MSRKMLAALATTVAALASVFAATSASAATPAEARLVLSVTYSDADVSGARTIRGFLSCAPDGGVHRNPVAACAELAEARGDLSATGTDETGVVCPMIYAPVTVSAVGSYEGTPVRYTTTYSNSCIFEASAGQVWNI